MQGGNTICVQGARMDGWHAVRSHGSTYVNVCCRTAYVSSCRIVASCFILFHTLPLFAFFLYRRTIRFADVCSLPLPWSSGRSMILTFLSPLSPTYCLSPIEILVKRPPHQFSNRNSFVELSFHMGTTMLMGCLSIKFIAVIHPYTFIYVGNMVENWS